MSKFCTGCGAQRAVEARFCSTCGIRFRSPDAPATPSSESAQPVPPEWFVQQGDVQRGPLSWDEVVALAGEGKVAADDLVWRAGDTASRRADSMPGLELQAKRRPGRHLQLAAAGVFAVIAAVVVFVVATTGGEEAGSEPAEIVEVGVAEVAAPDPAALIVDESGAIVPGDQVLVTLREGTGRDGADRVASIVAGEVVGQIEVIDLWQIRIPPTDLAGLQVVIDSLLAQEEVELAAPNTTSTAQQEIWGERVDPMREPTYRGSHGDGFRMIGVEAAWQYLRGSGLPRHQVKVGVTDTGLYRGTDPSLSEFPPDRTGTVKVEFPDPNAGDIDPDKVPSTYTDDVATGEGSHGTGVLTVLAGNPDDGGAYGVAGELGDDLTVSYTNVFTAPYGSGSLVVPAGPPVDQTDPGVTTTTPVEHIEWNNGVTYTCGDFKAIVDQIRGGARVINMSWGTTNSHGNASTAFLYRRFFERLAERHPEVLFVASGGNDGIAVDGSRRWPSGLALPNMITVGNLENDGSTVSHSNTASANYEITLAAPGEGAVRGFGPDGTPIASYGGTSNAAPQVTGAAALLLSIKPDLTAAQIKELLTSTARTSITRSDGTDHAIDAGVGGRVLAVDLAVFQLIKQERLRLGLDEPNPDGSSPLTPEQLLGHGVVDAVAVSSGDEWTVRGIVAGCGPDCTSVAISVSEGSAISGDTTQVLTAPGDATWSVSFTELPGTILVRRTDNGAGSRIIIPETSTPSAIPDGLGPFDGFWEGEHVVTETSDEIPWETELGPGAPISWMISTTPDGAGGVEIHTVPAEPTASVEWTDSTITIIRQAAFGAGTEFTYSGSLSQDGSTITGSWEMFGLLWGDEPEFIEGGTFTVTRALGE